MNIAGIWCPESSAVPPGFDAARPGLGLMLGPAAQVVQDQRYLLVLEGAMFDVAAEAALTNPQLLQAAYGLYSYIWFDLAKGEGIVGTDRLGYSPIYYARDARGLLFSTSLTYLKSQLGTRTPDYEAWEELCMLGELVGDKTTVREIRRLNPGTTIALSGRGCSFPVYWSPEVPDLVDEATYMRDNNALLDQAMALTASQTRPKVVALSGGEDSRRIADSGARLGMDIRFFTQQAIQRGNVDKDTALAREVARLLERPFEAVAMPTDAQFLDDCTARDRLLGFECLAHEWLLELVRHTPPDSLIYDGIIGDVSINGHYFKAHPKVLTQFADSRAIATMVCGSIPREWLNEIRRRTETPLLDRVQAVLEGYPNSPHRLTYYFLLNHTRRRIALAAQLFNVDGHWTAYPYGYYPLLVQSLSLDPRIAFEKFMQRECLANISPRSLTVPTTRGKVPGKYIRDMGDIESRRQTYFRRTLPMTEEALDAFPSLRVRAKAVPWMRLPFLAPALSRFGWFIEHVSRFGGFLDWLRSNDNGPIPLRAMPRTAKEFSARQMESVLLGDHAKPMA